MLLSSNGLGHWILSPKIRVRLPVGVFSRFLFSFSCFTKKGHYGLVVYWIGSLTFNEKKADRNRFRLLSGLINIGYLL